MVDDLQGYDRYTSTGTLVDSVSAAAYGALYAPWIALNPVSGTVTSSNQPVSTSPATTRSYVQSERPVPGNVRHHGRELQHREFGLIRGVDVDSSGNLYVDDVSNHCVQVFSPSGGFERYFSTKSGLPSSEQLSSNTRGLTIDRTNGLVYIADAAKQDVAVFTTTGTYKGVLGTPGTDCAGGGQLDGPGHRHRAHRDRLRQRLHVLRHRRVQPALRRLQAGGVPPADPGPCRSPRPPVV